MEVGKTPAIAIVLKFPYLRNLPTLLPDDVEGESGDS